MISSAILKRLAALNLPTEAFQEVLAIVAELEGGAPPSAGAVRQARYRERKRNSDVTRDVTGDVTRNGKESGSPAPASSAPSSPLYNPPPTPPTSPPKPPPKENARASVWGSFDAFWQLYPHKVGKQAALKAFEKAQKVTTYAKLMAGLQAYVRKTDDRPWCNPATWLNQHRWEDAPARGPPRLTGYHAVYEQLTNGGNHGEGSSDDGGIEPDAARTIDHEPDLLRPLGELPERD